jgi:hypothetical protein
MFAFARVGFREQLFKLKDSIKTNTTVNTATLILFEAWFNSKLINLLYKYATQNEYKYLCLLGYITFLIPV